MSTYTPRPYLPVETRYKANGYDCLLTIRRRTSAAIEMSPSPTIKSDAGSGTCTAARWEAGHA